MTERYVVRPFLELLDSYVLDAIGALDPAADTALTEREGDWRATVVHQMQFPDGMAGAIREVWEGGRKRFAAANGREPDPLEFARVFIDNKFPQ